MTDQKKSTVLIALIATTAFFVLHPADATTPSSAKASEDRPYPRPTSQPHAAIRYDEIVLPTIGATAEHRIVTDDAVGSVSDPIPDAATVTAATDAIAAIAADPTAREGMIQWIEERLPSAAGALLALLTALLGVLVAVRERTLTTTRATWTDVTRTVTTPVTTTGTRMIERLVDVVTTVPRTVLDTVTTFVERVTPVVRQVPRTIVEIIEQIVPRTVEVLRQVPRTVWDTVTRIVPRVVEVVRSIPRTVADWVTALVATTVPVVRQITEMVPRMVAEVFAYPVQVARTVWDTVMTSVREFVQVTKQVAREVVEWVQPNGTVVANPSGAGFLPAGGNYAAHLGALPGDGLFRIGSTNDPDRNLYLRRGNTIVNLTNFNGIRMVDRTWKNDYGSGTIKNGANEHFLLPGRLHFAYGEFGSNDGFRDAILAETLRTLGITRAEYDRLSVFNPSAFADARIPVTETVVASRAALASVRTELDARVAETQTRAATAFTVHINLPAPGTLATSVGATPGAYQTPQPVVRTVYDTVVETVERWVEKPVQVARTVWDTVMQTGTRMVETLVPVVRTVTDYVTNAVPTLVERLRTVWETVTDTVTEFVTETAQVARTVYDTVKDTVTEWVRVPVATARTVYDAVTEYVRETVPVVTAVPRTVYDTVVTTVPRMVEETFAYVEDMTTTVTERVKTLVNTSATATAWAMAVVRDDIGRVGRQIAALLPRASEPLAFPITDPAVRERVLADARADTGAQEQSVETGRGVRALPELITLLSQLHLRKAPATEIAVVEDLLAEHGTDFLPVGGVKPVFTVGKRAFVDVGTRAAIKGLGASVSKWAKEVLASLKNNLPPLVKKYKIPPSMAEELRAIAPTVYTNAEKNAVEFIETVQQKTGKKVMAVGVKDLDSFADKFKSHRLEGKWNTAEEVHDVLRGTILVEDETAARAALQNLEQNVYEVKDYFRHPNERSYRGINAKLRLSDGSLAELQIHTQESLEFAERTHPEHKARSQ